MPKRPPPKGPRHNYDTTAALRQRKRRALFRRMREALQRADQAATWEEAKKHIRDGLDESFSKKDED